MILVTGLDIVLSSSSGSVFMLSSNGKLAWKAFFILAALSVMMQFNFAAILYPLHIYCRICAE